MFKSSILQQALCKDIFDNLYHYFNEERSTKPHANEYADKIALQFSEIITKKAIELSG